MVSRTPESVRLPLFHEEIGKWNSRDMAAVIEYPRGRHRHEARRHGMHDEADIFRSHGAPGAPSPARQRRGCCRNRPQ